MTDKDDIIDINIAATLRDIAANCDKTTGKVLKLCNAAAAEGKSSLLVKVSTQDRDYLLERWFGTHMPETSRGISFKHLRVPPLIEKLESLGFTLQYTNHADWLGVQRFILVSW